MGYASHAEDDDKKLTAGRFLGHSFRRPGELDVVRSPKILTVAAYMRLLFKCQGELVQAVGKSSWLAAELEELLGEVARQTIRARKALLECRRMRVDSEKDAMLKADQAHRFLRKASNAFKDHLRDLGTGLTRSRKSYQAAQRLPADLKALRRPEMAPNDSEHAVELIADIEHVCPEFCRMIESFERLASEAENKLRGAIEEFSTVETEVFVFKEGLRERRRKVGQGTSRVAGRRSLYRILCKRLTA